MVISPLPAVAKAGQTVATGAATSMRPRSSRTAMAKATTAFETDMT